MLNSASGKSYWRGVMVWGILLLVVFELFIRLFVFKSPPRIIDPVWGLIPRDGSCYVRGTEGLGVTCYFANGEIATPYQNGRPIVFLGDSYTEALQVDNADKYVSVAEVLLRDRGYDVDLHNLGDSGRTLADFIYRAPAVNSTYSPKIIVLQTNSVALRDAFSPSRNPHFAIDLNGSIQLVYREETTSLAFRNSVLSSGLMTYSAFRWESLLDLRSNRANDGSKGRDTDGQILAEIQMLSAAYPQARLVLLVIPRVPIITPSGLVWDNPDDISLLGTLNEISSLTVVYPSEEFLKLYKEQLVFPRGFSNSSLNAGHLNRNGHAAVAEAVARALEALLK